MINNSSWFIAIADKVLRKQAPNQEPTLELHSRGAQSVEGHHRSVGPDMERKSRGRLIKKIKVKLTQQSQRPLQGNGMAAMSKTHVENFWDHTI